MWFSEKNDAVDVAQNRQDNLGGKTCEQSQSYHISSNLKLETDHITNKIDFDFQVHVLPAQAVIKWLLEENYDMEELQQLFNPRNI